MRSCGNADSTAADAAAAAADGRPPASGVRKVALPLEEPRDRQPGGPPPKALLPAGADEGTLCGVTGMNCRRASAAVGTTTAMSADAADGATDTHSAAELLGVAIRSVAIGLPAACAPTVAAAAAACAARAVTCACSGRCRSIDADRPMGRAMPGAAVSGMLPVAGALTGAASAAAGPAVSLPASAPVERSSQLRSSSSAPRGAGAAARDGLPTTDVPGLCSSGRTSGDRVALAPLAWSPCAASCSRVPPGELVPLCPADPVALHSSDPVTLRELPDAGG